jgi:high-affinity iron transporter
MNLAVASQSALILVREGAEALLIVAALLAFLVKTGERARGRFVFGGALAALLASLVTAWIFVRFFEGNHNDAIEAATMLLAAALLFYVSGWLFLRQDPRAWQGYLREQASAALVRGNVALAAVGFLAVYREGAETILFLHALAVGNDGWSFSLLAGLGFGLIALVAVYVLIQTLALKVPLRPLFAVTSAFLFVMGLSFVAGGLRELQEMEWVPLTDAPGAAFIAAIGLDPSLEILGTQLAICTGAVLSLMALRRRTLAPIKS